MKTVEIAIGLSLVYLLLSLFVTIIMELYNTISKSRGRLLKTAITRMLNDGPGGDSVPKPGTLADSFYKHPMIKALSKEDKSAWPSYITDKMFTQVLMEFFEVDKNTNTIKEKDTIIEPETKEILQTLANDAIRDKKELKEKITDWYNDAMERVTGWYTRRTKRLTALISLVVAIALNANTLNITQKLNNEAGTRLAVVNYASAISKDTSWKSNSKTQTDVAKQTNELIGKLSKLYTKDIDSSSRLLDMGWPPKPAIKSNGKCLIINCDFWSWLGLSILGWLITALAISLGAPFWFDLLNKFMQIRGSGANPDENKKKAAAKAEPKATAK